MNKQPPMMLHNITPLPDQLVYSATLLILISLFIKTVEAPFKDSQYQLYHGYKEPHMIETYRDNENAYLPDSLSIDSASGAESSNAAAGATTQTESKTAASTAYGTNNNPYSSTPYDSGAYVAAEQPTAYLGEADSAAYANAEQSDSAYSASPALYDSAAYTSEVKSSYDKDYTGSTRSDSAAYAGANAYGVEYPSVTKPASTSYSSAGQAANTAYASEAQSDTYATQADSTAYASSGTQEVSTGYPSGAQASAAYASGTQPDPYAAGSSAYASGAEAGSTGYPSGTQASAASASGIQADPYATGSSAYASGAEAGSAGYPSGAQASAASAIGTPTDPYATQPAYAGTAAKIVEAYPSYTNHAPGAAAYPSSPEIEGATKFASTSVDIGATDPEYPSRSRSHMPEVPVSAKVETVPKSTTGVIFPWNSMRLPDFIVPMHYSLFMHPNLTKFEYTGGLNITFMVTAATNYIVFHSNELNLTYTSVMEEDFREIQIVQQLYYLKHDQVYLEVAEMLTPYKYYFLSVYFMKRMQQNFEGFYISAYENKRGQKRYIATTHFEPTKARTAFPCFDEPSFKSTFQLAIAHNKKQRAYFNSQSIRTSPYGDGLSVTLFEKTFQMSTYLVAFVVCDFKEIHRHVQGVKIQVIVPPIHQSQAEFALDTASKLIPFYSEFFNFSYPLRKLDMIAIPNFAAGAMENWGLITFRLNTILFSSSETSNSGKEEVARIIASEMSHQWFGNLVTMEWWNDLWLNEGFACFLQYFSLKTLFPSWRMMEEFLVSVTQDSLSYDSLQTAYPVIRTVASQRDIISMFDSITYKKVGSIINMLREFLSIDTLKQGITYYLTKYQYTNARTEDFWTALTEVVYPTKHLNISRIMDTWTRQEGFPLITVTIQDGMTAMVKQRRFVSTPPESPVAMTSPYGYKWIVPVTYRTDVSAANLYWLNMTDGEFPLPIGYHWLKLNLNQTGFYRVMYDENMWKTLVYQLYIDHMSLSPADRANLLDDAFTLAHVGILDPSVPLDMTRYLYQEDDFLVWATALLHLDKLDVLLHQTPVYSIYHKYIRHLLKPVVKRLGFRDVGDHTTKKLRKAILVASFHYNDKDVIAEARRKFHNWMMEGIRIPPNLRNVVYFAGIKYGGETEWQFCWKKYKESKVPTEKISLLTALGKTQSSWQLSQYLNRSLDTSKVTPQDVKYVISVTSRNPVGRLMTWRFLRMNWPQLQKQFGHYTIAFDNIISQAIHHFSTKFDYAEVKKFFSEVDIGPAMKSVQQSLERIRANIRWREKTESAVARWLMNNEVRNSTKAK